MVSKATVDEEQADESIDQNDNESELEAKKALDKEKLYLLHHCADKPRYHLYIVIMQNNNANEVTAKSHIDHSVIKICWEHIWTIHQIIRISDNDDNLDVKMDNYESYDEPDDLELAYE